jgi:hypothetical protein
MKGRNNLEDLSTNGKLLKWISKKQGVRMCIGFIWLMIRATAEGGC